VFRPAGGDFQGMGVYRSDVVGKSAESNLPRSDHRLVEPTRLSLSMVASQQCRFCFTWHRYFTFHDSFAAWRLTM
jgi:hypothetical protein